VCSSDLAEEGTPVIRIDSRAGAAGSGAGAVAGGDAGASAVVDRALAALEAHPRAILALSLVFFETSELLPDLPRLLSAAHARSTPVIVDAYHAAHALPLDVASWPGEVFVVGGGYKYAEHGEGACWLHVPASADRLRPVHTGWFADFAGLEHAGGRAPGYATGGDRFLGSTFDPTAYYRALRVMEWMDREGLTVPVLRAHSLAQTQHLIDRAGALPIATPRDPARRGGFVAFTHPRAIELVRRLSDHGVRADARGPYLRLGPAPYTTTTELDRALAVLATLV
jgi:kynureninase